MSYKIISMKLKFLLIMYIFNVNTPALSFWPLSLDKYIVWAKNSAMSSKDQKLENMLFSAWEVLPLYSSLIDAYVVTHDKEYLKNFVYFYKYFLSYRGDISKLANYEGKILPQWYRAECYDIFHASPYYNYSANEKESIIKLRDWKNLRFSDVNYDGLFLEQILRFAKIIKSDNITEFFDIAQEIIDGAAETIKSHDLEWVEVSKEKGYYIFPKNCPFFIDGVEMPINEAAIFGSVLVLMYELTNEPVYIKRAKAMANRWLDYVTYDNDEITYPYVVGAWFTGWKTADKVSSNTPSALPYQESETFHKAALTISFMKKLYAHDNNEKISKFLEGVEEKIARTCNLNFYNISFFPHLFDSPPTDSYHVTNPIHFQGWIEIAKNNKDLWEKLYLITYATMQSNFSAVSQYLAVLTNLPKEIGKFPQVNEEIVSISPHLTSDFQSGKCLYNVEHDSVAYLSFQHLSPKHNTLFLSPVKNFKGRGIRLDVENGLFKGVAYLKKGDCINWHWNNEGSIEHGQPATAEENSLKMHLYYIKK